MSDSALAQTLPIATPDQQSDIKSECHTHDLSHTDVDHKHDACCDSSCPTEVSTNSGASAQLESDDEDEKMPNEANMTHAQKMISKGKKSENKQYRKLMKQMQNNPKLQEIVNFLQKNPNMKVEKQEDLSVKDRLKQKLQDSRRSRGSRELQKSHQEKVKENAKKKTTEVKTDEQKQSEMDAQVQSRMSNSMGDVVNNIKRKKAQKEKLKKLQHKYGQLTFDRYSQALKLVAEGTYQGQADKLNAEKNIIELYLKQNPTAVEKQLQLPQVDEVGSDEELEDLDSPSPKVATESVSVAPAEATQSVPVEPTQSVAVINDASLEQPN
jgi:hypothetical protein